MTVRFWSFGGTMIGSAVDCIRCSSQPCCSACMDGQLSPLRRSIQQACQRFPPCLIPRTMGYAITGGDFGSSITWCVQAGLVTAKAGVPHSHSSRCNSSTLVDAKGT
jgi:hypothetical protein